MKQDSHPTSLGGYMETGTYELTRTRIVLGMLVALLVPGGMAAITGQFWLCPVFVLARTLLQVELLYLAKDSLSTVTLCVATVLFKAVT